ncbi:MAG: hypothetical protein FK731_13335 [Asgard group archaeon]|nr:hypothetical protein [Asgard group archaeon]
MEFKTYDESRLDDHIELVQEVIKEWDWESWYPTKEQLKRNYSSEGFTPETRHYLYDNEKLIAFLSSAVEEVIDGVQHGSIHRLFIRKGYEYAEDKIMKKTIDELKARGVKIISTSIKPGMGNLREILERWGFGERTIMDYSVIFPIKEYVNSKYQKPDYIIDIDFDTDLELLVNAIYNQGSQTKEYVTKRLEAQINNNRVFAAVVAKKDEKILSYGLLYHGNRPERAFMSSISLQKNENGNLIKDIFYFLVEKANKFDKSFLYHQITDFSLMEHYTDLNLKFVPSYKYILRLL